MEIGALERAVSFRHGSEGMICPAGQKPLAAERPSPSAARSRTGPWIKLLLTPSRAKRHRTRTDRIRHIRHAESRNNNEQITGAHREMFMQVNSAFTLKTRRSRSEHNRDSYHAYFVSWTTHLPWGGAGVRLAFVEARPGSANPAKTGPLDRFSRPPLPPPTRQDEFLGNVIRRRGRKPPETPLSEGRWQCVDAYRQRL